MKFISDALARADGVSFWDFASGFPMTARQEGLWRRKGGTKISDRSIAWGETDRGNGCSRNVLGTDFPELELKR
jgi:hypothetical protein